MKRHDNHTSTILFPGRRGEAVVLLVAHEKGQMICHMAPRFLDYISLHGNVETCLGSYTE